MVLPISETREQSISTPTFLCPPIPQYPAPRDLDTWAQFTEAYCCLRSESEMSSCWKFLSHGNKTFRGEGGT